LTNHFFSIFDIASALFILLLIVVHSFWVRHRHSQEAHYRYFLPSVYFKLFFALGYSLFYIIYYNGGGDTIAYWDGAVKLNDLFYSSPHNYFAEIFSSSESLSITEHFNQATGYPPRWIYSEPESWLVCKIFSVVIIAGFKGYLAVTFLLAYLAHYASWKLFEIILGYKLHREWLLAVATLFIPSVSFWCSGLSKDTLLYIAMLFFIVSFFRILQRRNGYAAIVICSLLLLLIRPVMFVAVITPLAFAFSAQMIRKKTGSPALRAAALGIAFAFVTFILLFIFTNGEIIESDTLQNMISEAAIVQNDFMNNQTYGENRYFLDINDYTVIGMFKSTPAAVIAGLYRPFLWESLTPSLILNGIESIFFIWVTIRFFIRKNLRERIRFIRRHELLVYVFLAMLFIAFFSGYTSIIFGVLVRIRSYALPLLLIILFADSRQQEQIPTRPEE